MSIYLISNRKVENKRFSNKGSERATGEFRVATVSIPKEGQAADYQLLEDYNARDYRAVTELLEAQNPGTNTALQGSAYMFYDLYHKMLEVKQGQSDTLFFIHGFANKLEDNMVHIKTLHDLYIAPKDSGIDHLVYVAWPSIGHKIGTYWNDQEDARETGRVLGKLFNKLRHFFIELFEQHGHPRCVQRIHLAAHSMGNEVLRYMLRDMEDHQLFQLFGETLLFNSDVEHNVFDTGQPFTKLYRLSSRIHMYINRSDEVLGVISRFTKNLNRRLGHKGPRDYSVLEPQTFVVDTTPVKGGYTGMERTLDHWGYIKKEEVIKDIRQVLRGLDETEIDGRTLKEKQNQCYMIR